MEVDIAESGGGSRPDERRAVNRQQWPVNADLDPFEEAVVQFKDSGVLRPGWIREALKQVVFIAELKVQLALVRNIRIVCVERLLGKYL